MEPTRVALLLQAAQQAREGGFAAIPVPVQIGKQLTYGSHQPAIHVVSI